MNISTEAIQATRDAGYLPTQVSDADVRLTAAMIWVSEDHEHRAAFDASPVGMMLSNSNASPKREDALVAIEALLMNIAGDVLELPSRTSRQAR